MDINTYHEVLFQKRRIFLGELKKGDAERIGNSILFLSSQSPESIDFCITSIGGDGREGLKIYDAVANSTVPVIGIVRANTDSLASVVLQGCAKRKMYRHATVHMHFPEGHLPNYTTIRGKFNHEAIDQKEFQIEHDLKMLTNEMVRIYAERSGTSKTEIRAILHEDRDRSAAELLCLGLIDEII